VVAVSLQRNKDINMRITEKRSRITTASENHETEERKRVVTENAEVREE